jgi:hypothetical protein
LDKIIYRYGLAVGAEPVSRLGHTGREGLRQGRQPNISVILRERRNI